MKILKYCILFLILISINSCVTSDAKDRYISESEYKITITSGIDSDGNPIDKLDRLPLTNEFYYICIDWTNVPKSNFINTCMIYDGEGQKIYQNKIDISNIDGNYSTTTSFKINSYIDEPGLWKIEVYIDKTIVIEKYVEVYIQE